MNSAPVPDFSALELARMLFAVWIVAAAVVTLLLFFARLKRRDYSLLYFGLSASLYGVRLFINGSARYLHHKWDGIGFLITFIVGIPFALFIAEAVVPRWKKLIWWTMGAISVCAIFGTRSVLLHRGLGAALATNSILTLALVLVTLVMLFIPFRSAGRDIGILRIGFLVFLLFAIFTNLVGVGVIPRSVDVEFIGFTAFLGCLGFVAVSQTQRNEERLLALNKEMEIARGIQAGLLPEKSFSAAGFVTASRYVPASTVAGDFYDFLPNHGGLGVLIADVSGHGVPAALSASMVKVAIRAQREWAYDPARVLTGLNSILCGNLQGQFVTAGYLYLDPARGVMSYAGAGHPPLLVWRAQEAKIETLEENGLMLGIFPEGTYKSLSASLHAGDRFVLYTDGITEAPSASGEEFGMERLRNYLAEHANSTATQLCDSLIEKVAVWSGNGAREQHDDLTLIIVDCKKVDYTAVDSNSNEAGR
jgi:sigma-B regulation protein RsbU (phosphoserine phosphatase)